MRILLTIARILVGVLFIFSGLVKANDPLGLSYKMQEYFDVWGWHFLNDYALAFALVMNVFEIVAGIAVLVGWRMKLFGWLLLLLIIFFTFLTGYAAFSGKITACGCFGDCIPLKPIQSFWKDVVLLVLILFLLINHKKIRQIVSSRTALIILVVSTIAVSVFQWYVLKHLPFIDCLPYKKGNDILEQMRTPPGFIPDEYTYTFLYEKAGKKYEFNENNLPEDIDTYEFKDTRQKLVKKGNDLKAKITDFNLVTESGNDTTQALLQSNGKYVLVFSSETDPGKWASKKYDRNYWSELRKKAPVYIVSSVPVYVAGIPRLTCDNTVIKTAARAKPTYFVMQGAKVLGKFSYADADELMELLK
jgi:uncharacterized membrane protein YphA (DoxX/SURF4 family)